MMSQNSQETQVSIDLNLVNHHSAQQLPRISSKKNIQGFESPKSSRSRVGTEFFIGYDYKQSNLGLVKQQSMIEDNKIKFSMMMDLPFVITGKEFLQRGKTYNAFKKVDILNNSQDNCQMKGIIIKRTSPIQEIQTSKKLGDAYYRKKKSRQTGTVFTCELWSRSYYDHILSKTQLKQLHLKMQESSKCKNYDERVEDIHRLFSKWQKQQSSFLIDYKDYLIQNDCNNTIYLDTSQNIHSTFEETLNSSKKSKFFQAVNKEIDQFQEDSLLENNSNNNQPTPTSKELSSSSNKIKQFEKLNNTSTSFHQINISQNKSKTENSPRQLNTKEMKQEIDGYLKEQILDQKEIKKRLQERQLSDLFQTSIKSS